MHATQTSTQAFETRGSHSLPATTRRVGRTIGEGWRLNLRRLQFERAQTNLRKPHVSGTIRWGIKNTAVVVIESPLGSYGDAVQSVLVKPMGVLLEQT